MNSISPQTTDLLSRLWRGGEWAYWWTPDGDSYTTKSGDEVRAKITQWFPLKSWSPVPAAWQTKNVYFSVHPCASIPATYANGNKARASRVRGRIEYVAAINCVFAELDVKDGAYSSKYAAFKHLRSQPIFPTVVIDSGGGLHAYWVLNETQPVNGDNRDKYRKTQAAWVDLVGGDDGAKDLARVLRLPGFHNRKSHFAPNYPQVEVKEYSPQRVYSFDTISEIAASRVAEIESAERIARELDAQRTSDVASGASDTLLDWAVRNAGEGSRHQLAMWLAGKLKAEGLAKLVANSVLKEFARRVSTQGTRKLDDNEMSSVVSYVWGQP